jgi:3-oxoacyl-[acyl-carrier protein] reductase
MTAVVTGGASGIGLGVAKRIAAEGGRVTIWDQDPARLKAAVAEVGGTAARADEVNVADPSSVERATLTAARDGPPTSSPLGRRGGQERPRHDYPIDEWKRSTSTCTASFAIGLSRSHEASRLRPHCQHRLDRRQGGNPTASAYSAKPRHGPTKSRQGTAKDGCVNTITPATIDTPILSQVSEAHINYMRSKIPMERFGTAEEATAIVCWLASRECSFTTGAVFDLSGGRATY